MKFVSRIGVFPFAPSLDHVGPDRSYRDDLRLLFEVISTVPNGRRQKLDECRLDRWAAPRSAGSRGFFDRRAEQPSGPRR